MPTLSGHRRFHSLDQLRAVMMVLGLVIHSAASYIHIPIGGAWPYQDTSNHIFFSLVVHFIHLFRMPLFFLMAGFFAAYLYHQRGALAMLRNRTLRVAIPFALFLPLLFPANKSGFTFAADGGIHGGWQSARDYLSSPAALYEGVTTGHLWFLYYLLLFYVAILLLVPILGRFPASWSRALVPALGRHIHSPLGLPLCSAVTFITLLPMSYAGLDTETGFLVQPKVLLAYGVFVVFGWLLYLNRDQVDSFGRHAWRFMAAGGVLSGIYLFALPALNVPLLPAKALTAITIWTLIYGFVGLFVLYYDRPNPYGRYLADASYWLYLIHLPLTIWIPGLMNGWQVSAFIKAGITLGATALITVITYHLFVRSTVLGILLSGKRYPRALPRYDALGNFIAFPVVKSRQS
jgi:peptidoglycan/LPS O-acetylase OafA/YrhL